MKPLSIKLTDLPDEILIIILKKLYNVDVLYSLIGVNKRFRRITHDATFAGHLTLLYKFDDIISPLPDPMLDRICSQILPSIHHKIKSLKLESTSMDRILATNYPNLNGLGLYGLDVEKAISLFTDDTTFTRINKDQITSFVIDINKNKNKNKISRDMISSFLFPHIFAMFINLQYLNIAPPAISYQPLSFWTSPPTVISSNLLELHVLVEFFTDCLYLLDGRFNQLHTFHVNIIGIFSSTLKVNNEEKLPNLRCFSLYCDMRTHEYDALIIPLLHRMLNLEELDLQLNNVYRNKGFIDGNSLKEDIVNYMTQLNKFAFNIRTFNPSSNLINLPSNEDIQRTFKEFKNTQIISCVDYFQKRWCGFCHIYSYPYRMKSYDNLTNNFSGGLFNYVKRVSLYDDHPFEYEFFRQIAQSFPFIKNLTIVNDKPQKNKLQRKSKKVDNQDLSIIEYPHLIYLYLSHAHDDYVEQFLVDAEMCLSNNVYLSVDYEALRRVTENFTSHATRINCAKLHRLHLHGKYEMTTFLKDYFPQTNIL
ncbi:unnamed protein product [Rotaria socialis]|uniref:F-box domain-containing protein n=2 Tax=Rotaria socialis TaxID=392032 RepID=A0A818KCV3_9BILA|nr:unnamed protein product [Rotaria socialis]CAF4798074.1 unnamed protein product [Rotaria socialis]